MTDNSKSALYMTACMAGFSVNDALIKLVAGQSALFQSIFLRGVFAFILISGLLLIQHRTRPISFRFSKADRVVISWRVVGELGGTLCFLTALTHMPLASATAILQALPLAITLCAAMFFGEHVGWRRYSAIAVGMVGMLFIVRPGAADFNVYSLLAIGAVGFIVLRDLATRRLSAQVPTMAVTLITTISVATMGAVFSLFTPWPEVTISNVLLLALAAVGLLIGYLFSILTMRIGDVGAVAPFRYSILIWAILLGIALFDEWPDFWTIVGASLLTASGVYTLHRERIASRLAHANGPGKQAQ
jgi:drug/metabolite transporter (DMT)-like permease